LTWCRDLFRPALFPPCLARGGICSERGIERIDSAAARGNRFGGHGLGLAFSHAPESGSSLTFTGVYEFRHNFKVSVLEDF
jgi:hypothetical protein